MFHYDAVSNAALILGLEEAMSLSTKQLSELLGEEVSTPEEEAAHYPQLDIEMYINLYKSKYGVKPRTIPSDIYQAIDHLTEIDTSLRITLL